MKKQLFNLNTEKASEKIVELNKIPKSDIAIIGISARLPAVDSIEQFWESVKIGHDFISHLNDKRKKDVFDYNNYINLDWDRFSLIEGGFLNEVDKFDHHFFNMSNKEACVMDPHQRIFLETVWNALEDSGYCNEKIKGSRTGIYIGFPSNSDYHQWVANTEPEYALMAEPGNIVSIIASRISYILDLKGPSMLVDTACSSSLVAVHLACQALINGDCDMAVTGGINLILNPIYDKKAERPEIVSPNFRSKTFDDSADGIGSGEGSIAFILKPLSKALQDGDNIHAIIKSSSINQDGSSIGITAPNALAQKAAIIDAWSKAKIDPNTVGYIEAHGTGTKLGDPIEIRGITEAFKICTERQEFCSVGSVKANVGHLDSAAGAIGLLKTVLCLKNKLIPPLAHFKTLNSKINLEGTPLVINTELQEWESPLNGPRRAGISSFGLSGTNCHIILEESLIRRTGDKNEINKAYILCLSAKTRDGLLRLVEKYDAFLNTTENGKIADICYTASIGRQHFNYRLAIVSSTIEDFKQKITKILKNGLSYNSDDGIFYGFYNLAVSEQTDVNKKIYSESYLEQFSLDINKEITGLINGQAELSEENVVYIADAYSKGAKVDWQQIYSKEKRFTLSIPVYPFEQKSCWVKVPEMRGDKKMNRDKKENAGELIKEYFKQYIAKEFDTDESSIGYNDDFFQLGVDSISIIQLKQEVKSKYNLDIPTDEFIQTVPDIQTLSEYIIANTQEIIVEEKPSEIEKTEDYIEREAQEKKSFPLENINKSQLEQIKPFIETTVIDQPNLSVTETIINRQLEIMYKQLEVLKSSGNSLSPATEAVNKEVVKGPDEKKYTPENTEKINSQGNRFFRRFIVKSDEELNKEQELFLNDFIENYINKTKKSRQLTAQYRKNWANDRFIMGFSQKWKKLMYPIMIEKAQGSRIWDVDGNEYIDFSMGFGAILLGYNNPIISKEVSNISEHGSIIGPVTPNAGEVAQLICDIADVERAAFYNSGTEAVMVAVRLARAATNRSKVVIFNGSFHGTFDGVNAQRDFTVSHLKSLPISIGTPDDFVKDIIVLEYDSPESLKIIQENAKDIAAVLVEPVQSRRPQLQPFSYLKELREITENNDIALIFDEVITGFRIHQGGAQAYFGVTADIVTYGKIVGGGMPIGVVAGKAKYIDKIDGGQWNFDDDTSPSMDLIVTGGTFSCHPISMTAAKAALSYIKEQGQAMYEVLNKKTEKLVMELNQFFKEKNIQLELVNCASIFSFKPKGNVMFLRFLFYSLIEKGVYLWEGATCFISTVHSDEDIAFFIQTIKQSCNELISSGIFYPKEQNISGEEKKKK